MNHPLDGVREKIVRAEAHLATVRAEIASHKNKCSVLAKKRPNGDSIFDLYINFPDPPLSLSCAISDCIQNLRTALDYLVCELALPVGEPPIHNLFPICNTPQVYKRQVEQRDRLHNVPDKARGIIESLQPYNAKGGKRFSHPLYILHKLINADKYRLPALTVTCRPQPTFIHNEPNGPNRIEGTSIAEPFQDGARLTAQRLTEIQADEVTMHIERGIYLPFRDLPWTDSAADTVLSKVVWFVKGHVVPPFESFFEQPSEASVLVAYK
jgi:hypothetical protein